MIRLATCTLLTGSLLVIGLAGCGDQEEPIHRKTATNKQEPAEDRSAVSVAPAKAVDETDDAKPSKLQAQEVIRALNEDAADQYRWADEDDNNMISGETNARVSHHELDLWKMGYGVEWNTDEDSFVLVSLPPPEESPSQLIAFFHPGRERQWSLWHPALPLDGQDFSNEEVEAAVKRLAITRWLVVYPDGINVFKHEAKWWDTLMFSHGFQDGGHTMYLP